MPETKGRAMAESAEDAESLVEQFRFFQWNTWDTAASASGGEAADTQTQTSRVWWRGHHWRMKKKMLTKFLCLLKLHTNAFSQIQDIFYN